MDPKLGIHNKLTALSNTKKSLPKDERQYNTVWCENHKISKKLSFSVLFGGVNPTLWAELKLAWSQLSKKV